MKIMISHFQLLNIAFTIPIDLLDSFSFEFS